MHLTCYLIIKHNSLFTWAVPWYDMINRKFEVHVCINFRYNVMQHCNYKLHRKDIHSDLFDWNTKCHVMSLICTKFFNLHIKSVILVRFCCFFRLRHWQICKQKDKQIEDRGRETQAIKHMWPVLGKTLS